MYIREKCSGKKKKRIQRKIKKKRVKHNTVCLNLSWSANKKCRESNFTYNFFDQTYPLNDPNPNKTG